MRSKAIALVVALVLSGCATTAPQTPIQKFQLAESVITTSIQYGESALPLLRNAGLSEAEYQDVVGGYLEAADLVRAKLALVKRILLAKQREGAE